MLLARQVKQECNKETVENINTSVLLVERQRKWERKQEVRGTSAENVATVLHFAVGSSDGQKALPCPPHLALVLRGGMRSVG